MVRRLVVLTALVALLAGGYLLVRAAVSPPAARPTARSGTAQVSAVALDPSMFAAGACERFAPTSGNRHVTVALDAGHGGIDPGGIGVTQSGASVEEADLTLPVELDAMELLRADGFTVVVTRTGDTTVLRLGAGDVSGGALTLTGAHDDVAARDVCANLAHAAALVGIYFDASSSPATAGSLTAFDTARPFAAANRRLATLVQTDVLAALDSHHWGIPDDGAVPDSGLGSSVPTDATGGLAGEAASYDHLLLLGPAVPGFFTTPSLMPGALIEPLYLTDPFEGSIAASSVGQQAIASGIAEAVERYELASTPSTSACVSGRCASGTADGRSPATSSDR